MSYNQFCPIAKAMEVVGEKWTMLIVRELLMGASRFSEMQRGLPTLSPALLSKRLTSMEQSGLVVRKRIAGQRGYEYFPTNACKELLPVIEVIGGWGMHWARDQMTESDFDPGLLMLYLERSVKPEKLIGNETVIRFDFNDVKDHPHWWIVVDGQKVSVCVTDPGKEVDIYFNVCVRVMCEIWMGELSYKRAINDGKLQLVGPKALTKNVADWLAPSVFAGDQPSSAILNPV
jgi:DNA-binding HxlR family transcriptional regulator